MKKALLLQSSILGEHSQSSLLVAHLAARWQAQGVRVTLRDLVAEPVPVLDGAIATALRGGDNLDMQQTQALALSNQLVEELMQHDTLVLAAPMYNFSVPTQLKNWFDFIARAGVTFAYTEKGPQGLVTGKKAIIITTRGGAHKESEHDHVTPYLKTVLGFIGITEVEVVYAEALAMGPESAEQGIALAKQQLNEIAA
ncbi:FMN-dependent NADH-azoreductase [Motilimonas sp. E26]|uniref:FMN-dependent NADH-azoreductase n=1 Tax=Motilimonas sp. E26 TaxID=2865674 RepID=UPI001E4E845C|nr:FMN-dependent NADH-azoreductase [Motilimonas sp. E26]MCE0556981.1 FMN-dependent NADH-azoreductase [Motilimonas sp. E26]